MLTAYRERFEYLFQKFAKYMLEIESPPNGFQLGTSPSIGTSDDSVNTHDSSAPVVTVADSDETSSSSSSSLAFVNTSNNTLIHLLIQPLEKRFKFHFCTARKTNNLDKVCQVVFVLTKKNYLTFFFLNSLNGIFCKSLIGSKIRVSLLANSYNLFSVKLLILKINLQ